MKLTKFEIQATVSFLLTLLSLTIWALFIDRNETSAILTCAVMLGAILELAIIVLGRCGKIQVVLLCVGLQAAANAQLLEDHLSGTEFPFVYPALIESPNTVELEPGRAEVIPVAVCAGVAVGVIGWIGIKIFSACLRIKEHQITNNPAAFVMQGDVPTSRPVPSPTGNPVTGITNDCPCKGGAAPGQPLPLAIDYSLDDANWYEVIRGPSVGTEFALPDTGYWRLRPLPLRIERLTDGILVKAPPGVLEYSTDLKRWDVLQVNVGNSEFFGRPGFYRVRMN